MKQLIKLNESFPNVISSCFLFHATQMLALFSVEPNPGNSIVLSLPASCPFFSTFAPCAFSTAVFNMTARLPYLLLWCLFHSCPDSWYPPTPTMKRRKRGVRMKKALQPPFQKGPEPPLRPRGVFQPCVLGWIWSRTSIRRMISAGR